MRRILLTSALFLAAHGPSLAAQMDQALCDKLEDAMVATARVVEESARMSELFDRPETRAEVGPKTRAAIEQVAAARLRLQATIYEFKKASIAAGQQLRRCSE